jgi:hypothetical protein
MDRDFEWKRQKSSIGMATAVWVADISFFQFSHLLQAWGPLGNRQSNIVGSTTRKQLTCNNFPEQSSELKVVSISPEEERERARVHMYAKIRGLIKYEGIIQHDSFLIRLSQSNVRSYNSSFWTIGLMPSFCHRETEPKKEKDLPLSSLPSPSFPFVSALLRVAFFRVSLL